MDDHGCRSSSVEVTILRFLRAIQAEVEEQRK
jgi:hypothetical protein